MSFTGRQKSRPIRAPIPAHLLSDVECDERGCREATSHPATCRCACGGDGHGHPLRLGNLRAVEAYTARRDRAGGVFALMGVNADDEPW